MLVGPSVQGNRRQVMRWAPRNSHLPAAWSRAVPLWLGAGQGHLGSQHPLGLWHGLGS